jgi:hypothetical protein
MHSAIRAAVIVFVLAHIASATGSPVAARRVQNGDMLASSAGSLDAAERAKLDLKSEGSAQYTNWFGPSSSYGVSAAKAEFSAKGKKIVGKAKTYNNVGPHGAISYGIAKGSASD